MLLDNKFNFVSIEALTNKFLYEYRNTPSTTTLKTPSEMLFSFKTRTLLDMLKPQLENKFCDDNTELKGFRINDKVWFKVHHNKLQNWCPAIIKSRISKVMYIIVVKGLQKKAHRDQLKIRRERLPFIDCTSSVEGNRSDAMGFRRVDKSSHEQGIQDLPKDKVNQDRARPPKRKQAFEMPSPKRKLRSREHLKPPTRFCSMDYP